MAAINPTIYDRNGIVVQPFPGTSRKGESEAQSHRKLTLPGSSICGARTDTPQYFRVNRRARVLYCRHVLWLHLTGIIPSVPAGRWEVEILLKYLQSAPWKDIDWFIYVEDPERHNSHSLMPPALHLRTGRGSGVSFHSTPRNEWARYSMGDITVPSDHCRVRLVIRGHGSTPIYGFSFGGLELKPHSVGWRQEALLLRMPESQSSGRRKKDDATLPILPKEIIVRIAQYLITPLPQETLLRKRY